MNGIQQSSGMRHPSPQTDVDRLDQAIRDGDETLVLELATLLKDNQQFIRPDVEYWKLLAKTKGAILTIIRKAFEMGQGPISSDGNNYCLK